MTDPTQSVLVLGGTGKTGSRVTEKLAAGGRALSRRGSHRLRLCGSIGMTRLPTAPLWSALIEFTS